jgi:hypothetical protein
MKTRQRKGVKAVPMSANVALAARILGRRRQRLRLCVEIALGGAALAVPLA